MKTAVALKAANRKKAEQIKNLIIGAQEEKQGKRRGRPPKAQAKKKIRTIREIEPKGLRVTLRKELPAAIVEKFVAAIDEVYPGLRINREGSNEYIFDHFYETKDHKFAPGWPVCVTSSGDKYWLDPDTDELIASVHNRECKEKME